MSSSTCERSRLRNPVLHLLMILWSAVALIRLAAVSIAFHPISERPLTLTRVRRPCQPPRYKDDFSSFPQRVQNTTDTLLDLTGRNVTDFLVKTYKDSGRTRYRRPVSSLERIPRHEKS